MHTTSRWPLFMVLATVLIGQPTCADALGGRPNVAILHEPAMPVHGCPSSGPLLRQILENDGSSAMLLSATQLADQETFSTRSFDVLVLPTGETFPAVAHANLIRFLRSGGDLVTMGGYAFEDVIRHSNGQWEREEKLLQARRAEATRPNKSLLSDGGFENPSEIPMGGTAIDRRWRRTSTDAKVTTDAPCHGQFCATVSLDPNHERRDGGFFARVPVVPGHTYLATGHLRAEHLAGPGIAYIAAYQMTTDENIVTFRDFAVTREPCGWQPFQFEFTPTDRVAHVRIQAGLYQKTGVAFFDDIQLFDVTGTLTRPINTATGQPQDGLIVSPDQIGLFDPSYPIQRACELRTAVGQRIVDVGVRKTGSFHGWAASGVLGNNSARWVPLLESFDRFGRPRGPAGALLLHHAGHFAGSCWCFFGIDNVDLFADPHSPESRLICQVFHFLRRKIFLHTLETHSVRCDFSEPVRTSVIVSNFGDQAGSVTVTFTLDGQSTADDPTAVIQRMVASGASEKIEAQLDVPPAIRGVAEIRADVSVNGRVIDTLTTGVACANGEDTAAGPTIRFADNYFTWNGRPLFLFGTDTYSRNFTSAAENPCTWQQELLAARDIGVNLYENLHYSRAGYIMQDEDWCKFLSMAQLAQQHQLVYMPGMLIGQNTAIGLEQRASQSKLCREYAGRLGHLPGLLYYINGDYQLDTSKHPQDVNKMWNRWLRARYGSVERLRATWQPQEIQGEFGNIPSPAGETGRWDDAVWADWVRFKIDLLVEWNQSHVDAVRSVDTCHPITSEYYSQPFDGMDIRATIAGQGVSNIGFFDEPGKDIDCLPEKIAFADLRARGKGVSIGEYGVKTHRAWARENGATGYHIQRTEEEQKRLFMAVAHYGLGLGCSKVQNWCLRDAQQRVFPWGMFYPHQFVCKDVAYVHRNQSILWRALAPVYESPELMVCIPSQMRVGSRSALGAEIIYRTCADLLSLHYRYGCIDDNGLEKLPSSTRLIIFPSPFAMDDRSFEQLCDWVANGGQLLLTGDLSYDENRRRSRVARLEQVAGIHVVSECFPNIQREQAKARVARFRFATEFQASVRPSIDVKCTTSKLIACDEQGEPVMVRNRLGKGTVYYLSDPIELAGDLDSTNLRRSIYAAVAQECHVQANRVHPDEPWVHLMKQATRKGTAHVLFNKRPHSGTETVTFETSAGNAALKLRNGWPGLLATSSGRAVLVNAYGRAAIDDQVIFCGQGQLALLSLDRLDLRHSQAMLIAPFEEGQLILQERETALQATFGGFLKGTWKTYETVTFGTAPWRIELDEDRATALILVCPPDQTSHWQAQVGQMLREPDKFDGY